MSDATPAQAVPDSFEAYAADRGDARFTEWLRARAEPDFSAAVDHRFAEELAAGTIDDAVFRRYLMQDYAFLDALVGTFGHAVGDAPDMAARSRLVEFLAVLTDDENDYFERSFAALDVPESAYADPEPTATTRAFEDLLGRAAREGGYAETLAVLVPAEWVYLSWADPRADADPDAFYLREWIDLHANDGFRSFVGWLREELDREGADASPRRRARLDRLFRRTVELERAFFETAYGSQDSDAGGEDPW
ncbi:Transcriptional activator TenA [Halorhabdus sp. SVX81]|uniref:TenA family protein n=1 Tax=Halorhabdus sp. SVX81 TaxID=2978283 RepID=UPI0023DA3E6F|nr:TenA family protein [Halorhabdus sp. SVX81]WEL17087.1 Transcriptional activator TenA [Halorhabdus sp. SVX81]